MAEKISRVLLLQTALPPYREQPVLHLLERLGPQGEVLVGDFYFDPSVRTADSIRRRAGKVDNHYLFRRRLLWQTKCWRRALNADMLLLELNPRILSSWFLLAIRRLLPKKRTALWGHAWPRRGRRSRTDRVRQAMRRLADVLIVYTEQQARELRAELPRKRVLAAPNAIYLRSAMDARSDAVPEHFIYAGRLVQEKKPSLLLTAFALAMRRLPSGTRLIMVGDGALRPELEREAQVLGITARVDFLGEVTDWGRLRGLYVRSLASVSPGYVGLSLIQSLGFGVPMIIAREEPHSPELEAAREGENSLFFTSDSAEELAGRLTEVSDSRGTWLKRRGVIATTCAMHYSVEVMVDRMLDAMTATTEVGVHGVS